MHWLPRIVNHSPRKIAIMMIGTTTAQFDTTERGGIKLVTAPI